VDGPFRATPHHRAERDTGAGTPCAAACAAARLAGFERLWGALYPNEQARIVQLLVERITVGANGIAVDLRKEGLSLVLRDMLLPAKEEAFACVKPPPAFGL
jgi:hypothetical protein